MKIFAGVLLLVMCLINGIAGLGYLLGGAIFSVGGEIATESAKEEDKDSKKQAAAAANASSSSEKEFDEKLAKDEEKNSKDLKDAGKEAKKIGAGFTTFGAFLDVLAIGQIVVAIMFFVKSQSARTIGLIVGAGGIAAEVVSILLTNFGVTNLLGLLTGVVVIVAALIKLPPPPAPAYAGGYAPGGYPPGPQGGYPPGPPGGYPPPGYGPPPGAPPGYGPPPGQGGPPYGG
jgi:hypothetical protein